MIIKNNKLIGFIISTVGVIVIVYIINLCSLAFTGITTSGKVCGFKISANGARKVMTKSSNLKGRSPFITYTTSANQLQESYSRIPQLFSLFSYCINEEVTVKYNSSNPSQIFLLDAKELPGIFLMLLFGLLCCIVGLHYLKK